MPIHKVLLVGIDAETEALVRRAFPAHTVAVVSASAGAEAIQCADRERPDVLLCAAATHPGEPEFVARLREQKTTARITVLYLTDEPAPGACGTISRRLDPATLAIQVRELHAAARMKAQLARLDDLGGTDFVQEMIGLFLDTSPPRLEAARAGLQAGDLEAVERAVHSLKSSAGNLGAVVVQHLAARIEEQAAARDGAALPALFAELEAAFASATARLEQEKRPRG